MKRRSLAEKRSKALLIFSLVCVGVSLLARILYRGNHLIGWETMAPAHGQFLFNTVPFLEASERIFHEMRHYVFWHTIGTFFYTMVPAVLQEIFPSQHYGGLVTFLLTGVTIWTVVAFSGLSRKQLWVPFLIWGASPIILSFSIFGWAYAPAFLPHGLALYMVLNAKMSSSWRRALLLGLLTIAVSWQLYEVSRTCLFVWLAGAVMVAAVPLATRFTWVALAFIQMWLLKTCPSGRSDFLVQGWRALNLSTFFAATNEILTRLFITPTLTLPTLVLTALCALFLLRRNRLFWAVLWFAQIAMFGTTVLMGMPFSRRFIVVEFYAFALAAMLFSELKVGLEENTAKGSRRNKTWVEWVRRGLIPFFIVGNLLQLGFTAWQFRTPLSENIQPLPFTWAPADEKIAPVHINLSDRLYKLVTEGHKVIPFFNLESGMENVTDPACVLERLYLRLGHKRFVENVFVFGESHCRYNCLPIYDLVRIPEFVGDMAAGAHGPLNKFRMETVPGEEPSALAPLRAALEAKFVLSHELSLGYFKSQSVLSTK